MTVSSFVAKVGGNKREAALELVTCKDEAGRDMFIFAVIQASRVEEVRQKLANQNVDFRKEGIVLFTGWGTPSEADKSRALAEFKKMAA